MDPLLYFFIGGFIAVFAVAVIWGQVSYRKQIARLATTRRTKLAPRPRTSISIERDGGPLWISPIKFYIDGRRVGEVSPEEVIHFEVPAGRHTVEGRLNWLRSSTVTVDVLSDEPCRLQCGIKKMFYGHDAPVWSYLFFHPRSVLYLERIPNRRLATGNSTTTIPLTIGFASLGGDELLPLLSNDVQSVSHMFKNMSIAPVTRFPSCEILFLYAHLRQDGSIAGINVTAGLRQIAELTGAKLVVLASPNPPDLARKSASLPGPKLANLVLTMNRNGNGFGQFFHELFKRMGLGISLLKAWVELAPQHPSAMPDFAPATLLLAEAGDLRFPESAPNPP